jgi:1-acyl-sn-glycerol-3-phosphate acyltransferase
LRPLLDRFVVWACRLLCGVFFRRLEAVGLSRLPAAGPRLFVANHGNSMVDPLLLFATLRVVPRFLAKSTLWKNPLLWPVLALGGAIPVYRRQDPGVDPAKNLETFARCHEVLAAGGSIALFPEGLSHSEPALAPLKTGAARIVLEAEQLRGPLGVRIVPVGLTFDDRERFRSRALVEVGEPLDPSPELARYGADPQAAVRELTERIDRALREVTLNYGSWEEAALIGRAADLFGRRSLGLPEERPLPERFSLHRAFIEGYEELARREPERTAAAAEAVADYDRLLRSARLTDEQVAARFPLPSVVRYLLRTVARLALVLPLAALGALLNWAPYRLAGWFSRLLARKPDLRATFKLFPSLLLFPGFWLAEAWLCRRLWGPGAGLGALAAAPWLGGVALSFNDRRQALVRGARAYLLLATRRRLAEELRRRREKAARAVEDLTGLYLALEAGAGYTRPSAGGPPGVSGAEG